MWENENEKQITLKIVESLAGNNLQSKVIEKSFKVSDSNRVEIY